MTLTFSIMWLWLMSPDHCYVTWPKVTPGDLDPLSKSSQGLGACDPVNSIQCTPRLFSRCAKQYQKKSSSHFQKEYVAMTTHKHKMIEVADSQTTNTNIQPRELGQSSKRMRSVKQAIIRSSKQTTEGVTVHLPGKLVTYATCWAIHLGV